MFSELFKIIMAIGDQPIVDFVDLTRKLAFIRKPNKRSAWSVYVQALRRYAVTVTVTPLALLVIGMASGAGWLVGLVGIFWAICTIVLFFVASPIGVLVEIIGDHATGTGKGYVRTIESVLLFETGFAFYILIVPIAQNIGMLPVVIIGVLVLMLLTVTASKDEKAKKSKPRKWAAGIVWVILVYATMSFYIPNICSVGQSWVGYANTNILALRKPGLPPAPFATNQSELNAAVAQAQQAQATSQTQSQPTPSGMRGYAVQPEQSADIRFSDNENVKSVQVADGQFTSWIYLPTVPGSFSTEINPPLGPGQSIVIYCLDGRVFVRTAGHNPVIAPGPQAISLMGRGWSGTETIRDLRLHQKSGQTLK